MKLDIIINHAKRCKKNALHKKYTVGWHRNVDMGFERISFKFCQVKFTQKTGLENDKMTFTYRKRNWIQLTLYEKHIHHSQQEFKTIFCGNLTWRKLKELANLANLMVIKPLTISHENFSLLG